MSERYIEMSKVFKRSKAYPVLAVEKIAYFDQDGDEKESARFLVPTENGNFLWVLSELFTFDGIHSGSTPQAEYKTYRS
jgi:hypothetical protein